MSQTSLATACCWTVSALAFQSAGRRVGSLPVNLIRLLMAVFLLGAFTWVTRGTPLPMDASKHVWVWLSLSGLAGFTIGDLCLFRAFVLVGARISMLLMTLVPLFTTIFGFLVMSEVLTPMELAGMALTNRILGFVNAPALMQRVVACMQGMSVDISEYARKRDLLCDGLAGLGYEFIRPPGTFYLFPRSPISDDLEFVNTLKEERILVVPGSGFNGPGYFRIAFCVDDNTIKNALPGFGRAIARYKSG